MAYFRVDFSDDLADLTIGKVAVSLSQRINNLLGIWVCQCGVSVQVNIVLMVHVYVYIICMCRGDIDTY